MRVSQRTQVRMMEVLDSARRGTDFSRLLYENDFPDWFVRHATDSYGFDWDRILPELQNGQFFYPGYFSGSSSNITGEYLDRSRAIEAGEALVEALAALATTFSGGESVMNALQLDGLSVETGGLRLIPLEGPVNAKREEDALSALVHRTAITGAETIAKHIADASSLYVENKYHPSMNESRNHLQALVDGISADTNASGAHAAGFPGGTANRIDYLHTVGFLTADEVTALKSAWGALSGGSHPGVPQREEARIGLVLALEFGQILLLKFENWKSNAYKKFTR